MTRVDFYLTDKTAPDAGMRLACRIAEKAYQQQMTTHIHAENLDQVEKLDDLLWTFRDGSFLPHEINRTAKIDPLTPITIGTQEPSAEIEVIINLSTEVPLFFSHHPRLAEIVDGNTKPQGRKRFRFYRDRGYAPTAHNI